MGENDNKWYIEKYDVKTAIKIGSGSRKVESIKQRPPNEKNANPISDKVGDKPRSKYKIYRVGQEWEE